MTIAVSRSHHSSIVDVVRKRLGIRSVVVSGSFGLKIGLMCERRAHLCIYPGDNTHQWDTCAPEAILSEAGGVVTDLNNESICYNRAELRNAHGVIATNRKAHQHITQVARDVLGAEFSERGFLWHDLRKKSRS